VVLQKRIIKPAAASIIIMIMEGICTWPEALTEKPGLKLLFRKIQAVMMERTPAILPKELPIQKWQLNS
jgi:hypothetical protein